MTTPRDDIAGLSERLRRLAGITRRAIETSKLVFPWSTDSKTLDEAATQLDALLKERDALQAENFTLRAAHYDATEGISAATKQAIEDELRAELAIAECLAVEMEARALRAEQERDEAYERAAEECDAMGAREQEDYGLTRAAQNYFRARNAIRRLASSPEKEKK